LHIDCRKAFSEGDFLNVIEKIQWSAANIALDRILRYIEKEPQKNLLKLLNLAQKITGKLFPASAFEKGREALADPDNVWNRFVMGVIRDVDRDVLKKTMLALGLGAGYRGTKAVRKNREKYKCNIPFQILLDPTSACNKRCKGCWSAEYGHDQGLSFEELDSIVSQGVELGTHFYMFTGGEPLLRKNDVIKLCEAHPDCAFLSYTNATLVDEAFCTEMKRVGNLSLAISMEGSVEENDARRGEGSGEQALRAMDLLKKNGCLFGISVCYTSQNIESVTSQAFVDLMIEKGVKFAWYFHYMPVGKNTDISLVPTPEQRKHIYHWLRASRNSKTGNPLFMVDFQNDGEYVGGCIAGGRNYFHINSAGDMEPCVFIHYSDSNIRTHTLLEALQNPLFKTFYYNQPFNDNHLRPCPMLENPERLREIVGITGAKSTDLQAPEDVETLCGRCDRYAAEWAVESEKLWNGRKHASPKTQYYRDTPEGKAEAASKQ
jgi:MoaA/NifB/PqqE/SkfB family radical SAM enzyme